MSADGPINCDKAGKGVCKDYKDIKGNPTDCCIMSSGRAVGISE